jgi:hypothetical protein
MTFQPNRPIIQTEVEDKLQSLCDLLETNCEEYASVLGQRAEAEADYKYRFNRSLVEQNGKVPVVTKEAIAHLKASGEYRAWKRLEAQEKGLQQTLTSIRSQLEALRTISANVRAAGG